MSIIWNKLIDCKDEIIQIFNEQAVEYDEPGLDHFNNDTWVNRVWANDDVRRAHIDVVDARDTRGLWMMHVCVFPVLDNDAPIYGFDVIAGKNKITGAFHDFSPSSNRNHDMITGYYDSVQEFVPKKQRALPEWATNIFTDKMLAAGNVTDEAECVEIIRIATDNLRAYFADIGEFSGDGIPTEVTAAQNYYCHNQQQNPHTPRAMKSLGLNDDDVDRFCQDMLFPKINI